MVALFLQKIFILKKKTFLGHPHFIHSRQKYIAQTMHENVCSTTFKDGSVIFFNMTDPSLIPDFQKVCVQKLWLKILIFCFVFQLNRN